MRTPFIVGFILTAAPAAPAQSSGPTWSAPRGQGQARPPTLVGYVEPGAAKPGRFTLSDKSGTITT